MVRYWREEICHWAGCAGPASTPSSSTTSPCEEARRFSLAAVHRLPGTRHRNEGARVVEELKDLQVYAAVFKSFTSESAGARQRLFFKRLDTLDVSTLYPFLLFMLPGAWPGRR